MVSDQNTVAAQEGFEQAVHLCYLIPERYNPKTLRKEPVCGNPSDVLRRRGFRIDYSGWLIPTHLVPRTLVAEMREAGAQVTVLRYDMAQREEVLSLVKMKFIEEIGRIEKSLKESIETTAGKFDKARRIQSVDLVNSTVKFGRRAFNKAKRLMNTAQEAALAFGITRDAEELLDGKRAAIAAAAETFIAEHPAKKGSEPRSTIIDIVYKLPDGKWTKRRLTTAEDASKFREWVKGKAGEFGTGQEVA